jgi:hypothetical protein
MPLDETLNMDTYAVARRHVALTSHLPNDDPKKFSFATPKEIPHAYLRLVDCETGNAPLSNRIIQDCEKWIRSLETIRQAAGKMVGGFGRNGHRERQIKGKRGGYQPKKHQGPAKWVHHDAVGLDNKRWRKSVDLVDRHLNKLDNPTPTVKETTPLITSVILMLRHKNN